MKWRFMFEVVTNPITIPATKTTRNERICTSLCKHVKFFSVVVVVSSLLLQRAIADSIKSLRQRRKPIYLCEFFFVFLNLNLKSWKERKKIQFQRWEIYGRDGN